MKHLWSLAPQALQAELNAILAWTKSTLTHQAGIPHRSGMMRNSCVVALFNGARDWVMSRANRFGFRAPVVAAMPAPDSLYTLIDEVRKNTAAQLSGSPQIRTASSSTKVKEFSIYDRILLDGWFGLTEQDKINGL